MAVNLICLAVGIAYLLTATPRFLGTATLLIDASRESTGQQQAATPAGDIAIDTGSIETQVAILKSDSIALAVVRKLDLLHDPEFVGPSGSLLARVTRFISALFPAKSDNSDGALEQQAVATFGKLLSVDRVGLTYILEVNFLSQDRSKAARIANAVADAYIADQLDSKFEVTKRAGLWLQERLKDIRAQADASERAVTDFKRKNNIVDSGGRLMNDQQLAEMNSELVTASANTAEAKARLERIQSVMQQGIPDASVADALKNDVIISVRQKYLDLAQREGVISNKYGHEHQAAVSLRNQMEQLRLNIMDEMKKIAESYKSDFEIAKAREESLRGSLADAVSASQQTNQSQAELKALESNAEAYRTIYENFLQRAMEASQQESFPITQTRLITPALPPLSKSQPNTIIVLAITIAGGLLASFGLAAVREAGNPVFRATDEVESVLRTPCSTVVPVVRVRKSKSPRSSGEYIGNYEAMALALSSGGIDSYATDFPTSRFTESIRALKVAVDLCGARKATKIIGVTSTFPEEGKTTIAVNLAQLISQAGAKVVLVDSDLRNPSLTEKLAQRGSIGLVDVIVGYKSLDEAVVCSPSGQGIAFLPAGNTADVKHSNEIIGSEQMAELVAALRARYDYVIVDLPPLAPIVDVRVATNVIDGFVYVVEWGKTRVASVERKLNSAPEVYERLIGVVLNKANPRMARIYDEDYHGYSDRYYSRNSLST